MILVLDVSYANYDMATTKKEKSDEQMFAYYMPNKFIKQFPYASEPMADNGRNFLSASSPSPPPHIKRSL